MLASRASHMDPKRFAIPAIGLLLLVAVCYVRSLAPTPAQPMAGTQIIALGDSLVSGGASPGRDLVSQLTDRIGATIINAGRSGDTTESALARLDRDVLAIRGSSSFYSVATTFSARCLATECSSTSAASSSESEPRAPGSSCRHQPPAGRRSVCQRLRRTRAAHEIGVRSRRPQWNSGKQRSHVRRDSPERSRLRDDGGADRGSVERAGSVGEERQFPVPVTSSRRPRPNRTVETTLNWQLVTGN